MILLGSVRPIAALVLGAALALTGCSGSATTPAPSASAARLGAAQLRLSVIDQLGPRWYCDPDEFPVARADEQQRAIERFPDMQAERDVFRAVAARLGLDPDGPLSAAQKLAIYQVWKVATSIPFEARSGGTFAFDYVSRPAAGQTTGVHTEGTIDPSGAITIVQQEVASQPVCPICLVIGTPIETPGGPVESRATPARRCRVDARHGREPHRGHGHRHRIDAGTAWAPRRPPRPRRRADGHGLARPSDLRPALAG